MDFILQQIRESMMEGDAGRTQSLTQKALAMGRPPLGIIKQVLEPTMQEIGERFRREEIFIPDVLMSARSMHASLYLLKPVLVSGKAGAKGRVVLGTVAGDLHDIGKNIIGMMLEGNGYEIIDVGIDVPVGEFVHAVKKYKPDVLGLSALLTTTMGKCFDVIFALKENNLRHDLAVLVGGAPVTLDFARKIGADGYAVDGSNAVAAVNAFMKGKHTAKKVSHLR